MGTNIKFAPLNGRPQIRTFITSRGEMYAMWQTVSSLWHTYSKKKKMKNGKLVPSSIYRPLVHRALSLNHRITKGI
jgi:hypothetical protein